MKKLTETNVKDALAGESQAHIKYLAFAAKASSEKLPNIARVFQAAAYSEQVHATNHLRALGGVGTTAANLGGAIEGETFEIEEMYPAYIGVAELQGEKAALVPLNAALAAEKVHQGVYRRAKAAVEGGQDIADGPVHVCSVCGFTVEGDAPDTCPVCGAPKVKFVKF